VPWTKTAKAFHFAGSPSRALPVLCAAGVHAVCLANNHVLDFNVPGLRDTLQSLDDAGIARAGAGRSLAEARAPAWVTVRAGSPATEVRVAMLAAADHPTEWAASDDKAADSSDDAVGINLFDPFPSPEALAWARDAAAAARSGGAHLIVLAVHYGGNWVKRPPADVRAFARALADASDVDVLFGTSAHLAQGVEVRSGKLLLYQAGDVIDDYAVYDTWRNDLGAAFTARFELHDENTVQSGATTQQAPPKQLRAKLCGLEITPLLLPFAEVRVAPPGAAVTRSIAARLRKLSAELGTQLTFDESKGVLRWTQ
jgi:poly-gamma-glutamate capsule biosynthesis protein CapA/YwtB (metallophosphatase superfamily)